MTLEVVMAQLHCMDACLDTLNNELCQVNTYVGRIARRQTRLGGFMASHSLFLEASEDEDEDDDGDFDDDDDDEDEDKDASLLFSFFFFFGMETNYTNIYIYIYIY